MKKEFEKGMEYADKQRGMVSHLTLGWTCIICSPLWCFFSILDLKIRFIGGVVILIIGGVSLLLGYSERKEIKIIESKWKK